MRILRWVGLLIVLAIFFSPKVLSQNVDSIGLTIHPAIVEVASNPGEIRLVNITVENTSANPLPVILEATKLIPIDDEIDRNRRSEFDASSWINIEEPNQVFASGEIKSFTYEINIPADANPGGHYALVGVRALTDQLSADETSARVAPELGQSIFISVAGDISESAEIYTSSSLEGTRITKGDIVPVEFTIRNTGNVHILPAPRITILKDGQPYENLAVSPQIILPNTEKRFVAEWVADVDYGSYQVQAETVYGSQSVPLAALPVNVQVWPPIWQIVAIAGVIAVIMVMLIRWKNIPKAMAILKGRAAGIRGSFKTSAGDEELPEEKIKTDYKDMANELDKAPVILGLPVANKVAKTKKSKKQKKKDEKSITDKEIDSGATVTELKNSDAPTKTVIIQTSSSTIVREEIDDSELRQTESKPTKIIVKHEDDEPAPKPKVKKPTSKPKKKLAKKKPSTKKKAKKAPQKKKSTKSSSKSVKKKSTASKKTTKKKPTKKKKKPTTKKQGSKKKSTKKSKK